MVVNTLFSGNYWNTIYQTLKTFSVSSGRGASFWLRLLFTCFFFPNRSRDLIQLFFGKSVKLWLIPSAHGLWRLVDISTCAQMLIKIKSGQGLTMWKAWGRSMKRMWIMWSYTHCFHMLYILFLKPAFEKVWTLACALVPWGRFVPQVKQLPIFNSEPPFGMP